MTEITEAERELALQELNVIEIKEAIKEMIIHHEGDYHEPLKMLIMKDGKSALVSQHAFCAHEEDCFNTCQAILVIGNKIIYNPEEIEGFRDYGKDITKIRLGNFKSDEELEEVFKEAIAEEIFKNLLDDYIINRHH